MSRAHRGDYARRRRAASSRAFVARVALLAVLAPAGAAAQRDTTRGGELDSLRERVRRAEAAIELLRAQLATQAEAGVQSASRVRVELFGRVLMNGFSNTTRVNNADVPLFAAPSGPGGIGAAIRQTSLGVGIAVARALGGTFHGELHTDFFGGQQPSTGGRHFPLLRIRTARGIVTWQHGELLIGQEHPLVAGTNPRSVAAFGTPEFVAAGNLWLWLPQFRGTLELGTPLRLALQAAVLAPASGDPTGAFDTEPDVAEQSRKPYVQARLRARWGRDDVAGEIGLGAHAGWLRRPDGTLAESRAVVLEVLAPLGRLVELRGEAYTGRALRGLGGGGIGQGLSATGEPVDDSGGWGQLLLRPRSWVELGGGCGVSDPDDAAVPAGRLRNVACAAHTLVRPGGPLFFGLTYRAHKTRYTAGAVRNNHVNVAAGFEF